MVKNVDVTIVGGGMVGLCLANALQKSGLRIAIIESSSALENPPHNELAEMRVSALNRASERILRQLDVWQAITHLEKLTPYHAMQVWEQDSFAKIDFDSKQLAQTELGHIALNQHIQHCLYQQICNVSNVDIFSNQKCQSLSVGERGAWLMLEDGRALSTKLVVGADGAHSWVRKQADIPLTQWDYGHTAIVANVETALPHKNVARQIFTPQGPLAFLPREQEHLSSIVWSTDSNRAENLMILSDEQFNRTLTAEFDARLGICSVVTSRQAIPLKMRYARDFVQDRVALIGDAAHTIHPLAGQGVNLGLLDAASLAQVILENLQLGKDIGSRLGLRSYERWRKTEATKMIIAMQGFKELFHSNHSAKKLLRGVGVSLISHLPEIKQELMQQALGLKGELPDLAKMRAVE